MAKQTTSEIRWRLAKARHPNARTIIELKDDGQHFLWMTLDVYGRVLCTGPKDVSDWWNSKITNYDTIKAGENAYVIKNKSRIRQRLAYEVINVERK